MSSLEAAETKDPWKLFHFFLGIWAGTGTGSSGTSSVRRSYALTLANQFIEIRNRSEFPPQENNPSGEVHEDRGFISYDKMRSVYMLREFHVEGYVNQYALEPFEPQSRMYVFLTKAIENIPDGWNARITLEIHNQEEFRETFDLAAGAGREWTCLIANEFHRVRGL